MGTDVPGELTFAFGGFLLTPDQLFADNRPVHIDATPFRLLRYVVLNRHRTVSRAELKQYLWPELTQVTDNALNKQMDRLRKVLGDDATLPTFIETRPKFGYHFIADTTLVSQMRTIDDYDKGSSDTYCHPTGRFERQADGIWNEYTEDGGRVIYRFEEFSRHDGYIYLKDGSRRQDPGRPFILRIPIAGGIAQWSFPNPLRWEDFTIVRPE
jgi:DNA-binding winged helix-turn-helix (wHTH) protein